MSDKVTLLPTPGDESFGSAVSNLANEVFESTGGDVYGSGRTTAEDAEGKSSGPEGEKTEGEGKKETTSSDSPFLGNWKTKDDAESGIRELQTHAKTALQRADEALREKQELEGKLNTLIQVLGGKKEEPVADPLETLENLAAIPREHFSKAVDALIERKFESIMKPVNDRRAADKQMLEIAPEYGNEVPNIVAWLDKNPDVRSEVEYAESKGEYLLARKFAWKLYNATRDAEKSAEVGGKRDSRIEKIKDALPDAGIINETRADTRLDAASADSNADWPSPERMKYLKSKFQDNPDLMWRETIGKMLEQQGFPG